MEEQREPVEKPTLVPVERIFCSFTNSALFKSGVVPDLVPFLA
jgi:hypothetical protein